MTSLPVPEQWTLAKLTDREVAEEIERADQLRRRERSLRPPADGVRAPLHHAPRQSAADGRRDCDAAHRARRWRRSR